MDRLRTSSSRQPRVELVTRTLPRFPNRRAWCAGCSWVPLPAVCVLPVAVVGLPLSNCRQRWQSGGWRISSAARFAALGSNADRAQRLLIGWPVDWVAPIGCFGGGRQFVLASTSGRIACLQNHPLEELPGRITRSNYQVELPGRITRSNYQVELPGRITRSDYQVTVSWMLERTVFSSGRARLPARFSQLTISVREWRLSLLKMLPTCVRIVFGLRNNVRPSS